MSRLIGLVGEAGTGEVRIRRSGAGDLDRGLLGQRSAPEWKQWSLTMSAYDSLHAVCVADTNLVLEAGREPLAGGWRGQCVGSFLHSHHWPKRMLMTHREFSLIARKHIGRQKKRICVCCMVASLIFSSYGSSSRKGWRVPAVFSTRASMTSWRSAQGIWKRKPECLLVPRNPENALKLKSL